MHLPPNAAQIVLSLSTSQTSNSEVGIAPYRAKTHIPKEGWGWGGGGEETVKKSKGVSWGDHLHITENINDSEKPDENNA